MRTWELAVIMALQPREVTGVARMVLTKIRDVRRLPHLAALKHRDYRFTWTANMFSGAAMWTFIVAVSWLTLDKLDMSGAVGILTFASMLPFLLVSPVAGLVADRLDRQRIARFTFIANGTVTAIVAVMVITDFIELWLWLWPLVILTFVSGSMRSMQEPAMASLIPNQVPREDLLNAITLNAATRHGARFFGLLVASPLLALPSVEVSELGALWQPIVKVLLATPFVGVSGVLLLSVACQVVGTIFISLTRTRSTGDALSQSGLLRSMADGLVYIYTDKMISIFILLVAFHCALVMSNDSILPVFSRNELGAVDGSILGYMVMGFGAGSLVGTVIMAGVRSERMKGRWLLWTGIISGLTPVLLAFSPNAMPAVAVMVVMGGAQSTFMALTTTYVQTLAPDRLRGRISSLYILHAGGIMAFANLGYGFTADVFSSPPILYVTAIVFLGFLSAFGISLPDLRRVYRTGRAVA